jgi:uncharacterized membrane protein
MDPMIPDEAATMREQQVSTPVDQGYVRLANGSAVVEHSENIVTPWGPRVRWGSILGGCVVAVGLLMILTSLGLALGFSLVNHVWQTNTDIIKDLTTSAGVWSAVSLLLAFFVASLVSTKVTDRPDRGGAVLHGVITWVLLSFLLPFVISSGIELGTEGVKGEATSGSLPDLPFIPSKAFNEVELSQNLGLDDPSRVSVRLTDPRMPMVLAAITGMSENEAQTAVSELQARVSIVKDDPAAINAEVQNFLSRLLERGRTATSRVGVTPHALETGSWIFFGTLVLTLFVSIIGALAGLPDRRRWRKTIFIQAY